MPAAAAADSDDEDDDDRVAFTQSAFCGLAKAVKGAFMREGEDVEEQDRLKYLHLAAVLASVSRCTQVAAARDAADAARAARAAGGAGAGPKGASPEDAKAGAARVKFSAQPLLEMLDDW